MDYDAEHIMKKTMAVRKKIREFYLQFPQYSPMTRQEMPRYTGDPEVDALVFELKTELNKK